MSGSLRNIVGGDCYSSIKLLRVGRQRHFGSMAFVPPSHKYRIELMGKRRMLTVQNQPATGIVTTRNMAKYQTDKTLTVDNVYSNLRRMEYAVRGPLLIRAVEIEKELEKVIIC